MWIHLWDAECHILYLGHCDLDLASVLKLMIRNGPSSFKRSTNVSHARPICHVTVVYLI